MLVMEAINSEKTWDEIKDLLRFKLYMLTFTHTPHTSWINNRRRRNH